MKSRDRARLAATLIAIWPSLAPAAEADHASLDAAVNPLAALSLDHLRATRDRPLFAPTRRPPPVVPVARQVVAPVATLAPPDVVLVGIVADQVGARAVVRNKSGKLIRAQSGDEIEGWKVTLIEPRRLVLSHDDRSIDLALFAAPAAGTGPASSSTAPNSTGVAAPASSKQLTFRRTGHD